MVVEILETPLVQQVSAEVSKLNQNPIISDIISLGLVPKSSEPSSALNNFLMSVYTLCSGEIGSLYSDNLNKNNFLYQEV